MPDDKGTPAAKKKGVRNAAIIGTVALAIGVGYFWIKNRQGSSGSSSSGTDTTGGVTGSGFTDMGDIIQTVQGPPGKTGATGKTGKTGASGRDDDEGRRSAHPCPPGMRYDFAQKKCVPFGVFGKPRAGKRKDKGGPRGGGGGH